MSEGHAKAYGASGSKTWMMCAGSVALCEGLPGTSSSYAREGTAAHKLGETCLLDGTDAQSYIGTRIPVEYETIEVDEDMARHVQDGYVAPVRALRDTLGAQLLVEQKLRYGPSIGIDEPDNGWGTGDAVLLVPDEIIVCDLKYGRGEEVEAEGNPQLMLYALGALREYGEFADFQRVRVIIYQPRAGGTREWTVGVDELMAFAEDAKAAVERAEQARACEKRDNEWEAVYLNPGAAQCRWCKAKATCPELRNVALGAVFEVKPATAEDFEAYTSKEASFDASAIMEERKGGDDGWLAACMAKADLIEDWLKAIRAETERRLLAGDPVEGFKLVRGKQGNRAWGDEHQAEETLKGFRLKKEDMYDMKLISPTTAEKLLAKDSPKRWAKVQDLITRSEGKIHVAPLSDKRPPVELQASADDFETIPATENPADNEFA